MVDLVQNQHLKRKLDYLKQTGHCSHIGRRSSEFIKISYFGSPRESPRNNEEKVDVSATESDREAFAEKLKQQLSKKISF